ncbi:hypothetical protein GF373_04310 [bacterium]|nr:hypothetical protein [bacterium]
MTETLWLAFVWYITFLCFGVIVLPLSMKVFRRMRGSGILLSRPLGWLLLGFFSWFFGYFGLPFNRFGIGFIALLLFAGSLYLVYQNGLWFFRRLKIEWRTALNGEIITLLVFLMILFVRYKDPNLDHTEKPMDAMMLNSISVSSEIPPPDAWFAGFSINYHYGGYLMHSVPIKAIGLPPEIGYNLSIAMVAAIGASIAFCLGRVLFGRCRWAVVSVMATLLIGNIAAFFEMFNGNNAFSNLGSWRWGYLWKTSRVIHDSGNATINEYPFFSILWADLHPHYSNIPFFLFFLAMCLAVYFSLVKHTAKRMLKYEWPLLGAAGIGLTMIFPTNVFDFPVASLFFGGVVVAAVLQSCFYPRPDWREVLHKIPIIFLPIASYILAFPFWLHFISPLGDSPVQSVQERTQPWEFFLVFGAHVVCTLVFVLLHSVYLQEKKKEESGFLLALFGLLLFGFYLLTGYLIAALASILALLFLYYAIQHALAARPSDAGAPIPVYAFLACSLAWALIAGCEYIFIKDNYGMALARMNTLFKFHFPAWILFGIGLPPLLYRAFRLPVAKNLIGFAAVPVGFVFVLSLAGPIYSLSAVYTVPVDVSSINGIAFLKKRHPQYYQIIQWIKKNTESTAILLEPAGSAYRKEENLFSAFTGRQSIIGWRNHEGVWRPNQFKYNDPSAVGNIRAEDTYTFFTTQNWEKAKEILLKYDVDYVAYSPPTNEDIKKRLANIRNAVYRQHLEPIFKGSGDGSSPELYKVPNSLKQERE